MTELENLVKYKFEIGELNLAPEVIELNKKWKAENRWNNSI